MWLWWCCDKKRLRYVKNHQLHLLQKVVSDIIEKIEIDEDKDEEKGVKVVEENGKVESDGKDATVMKKV